MPFYVEENESHEIDMMVNMNKFNYHLDEDFGAQIIELPYEGSKLSMYVLLPTKVGSSHLRELKKKLTFERIEDLIGKMKDTHCSLGLPRMRLSSELELRDVLGAMGLETLFDPAAADLSYGEPRNNNNNNSHEENATTSHRAYLDEIVQKVEMSVTESGTKAAAADIGIIDRAGGIYKRFLADHPFLFFIRHKVTKSILFYGTINKP
uniref:Serpin domain-containing protein n=1 Tax=Trichogramma kaykai TaxID=54128 RepID=A0ABD2WCD8_9HYME